jgi:CRP-like cAMP-binding protein
VSKEAIFGELARNPRFASRIIGTLAGRVESLVHELNDYALGSAARRFVAWLLRSAGATRTGEASVTLPAAKRMLAMRLNLSAEHLSRILRELSAEGLIRVHAREVTISDVERLRAWQRRGRADAAQP